MKQSKIFIWLCVDLNQWDHIWQWTPIATVKLHIKYVDIMVWERPQAADHMDGDGTVPVKQLEAVWSQVPTLLVLHNTITHNCSCHLWDTQTYRTRSLWLFIVCLCVCAAVLNVWTVWRCVFTDDAAATACVCVCCSWTEPLQTDKLEQQLH